jgi:hypothetical protein
MQHVHLQLQTTVLSAASSAASSEVQLQLQPEVQLHGTVEFIFSFAARRPVVLFPNGEPQKTDGKAI